MNYIRLGWRGSIGWAAREGDKGIYDIGESFLARLSFIPGMACGEAEGLTTKNYG